MRAYGGGLHRGEAEETSCHAQYTNFRIVEPRMGDEPLPKAIVWSDKKAEVLIEYKNKHNNYVEKDFGP